MLQFKNTAWYLNLKTEFWRHPNRLTALKVVTAMFALVLPFIVTNHAYIAVTLALGVVAAALSETDDHPRGRLKALITTIISFAITTCSVTLLKPFPLIFGFGFIASTIVFVIIGGISERYRGISYGAILIGIYAMLGYDNDLDWYVQPFLLCSGALFYGLISLFLLYRKPWRLLDEQLSMGFIALSKYLEEKSKLFPSSTNEQVDIGNKLALLNVEVVNALEKCKEVINIYSHEVDDQKDLLPYLQRFMLLQSLHERAASSHEKYERLGNKIEYKELLEGFSELLHQLSHAAELVAENMLTGQEYNHPVSIGWIVNALEFEIEKIPEKDQQLLILLLHNLSRSHVSLKNLNTPERSTSIPRLGQDKRTVKERIKDQLRFSHPRMRYAIRLSFCFTIGFLLNYFLELEKGEWIYMTSLFVSQPTYRETRQRLFQRILGTISGVVIGVSIIQLLPTDLGQMLLMLSCAFFFFLYLRNKYSYAVVFITIYVLSANNLTSSAGMEILIPRTIDTVIGALLSFLAVRFLWPNWQYKRVPKLLADALDKNANYFHTILNELNDKNTKSDDDYDYRLARRLAHKADNELTLAWRSMRVEPHKKRKVMDQAFTLTYLNHALLSYVSALGAQRDILHIKQNIFHDTAQHIENTLVETSHLISNNSRSNADISLKPLLVTLKDKINELDVSEERQQLRLLYNIGAVSNKIMNEASAVKR
ncbi:FUSC family membrane protein [Saccharicrinis aurantiacus]|uniref:FUSC family membrane protein n=1 Tax=Saccharicrinis aurantiacus TaxID=1849719 RepID=UPI0024909F7E|nr:FUSC family membrane protein [Saccharicrinis aurantiacus]